MFTTIVFFNSACVGKKQYAQTLQENIQCRQHEDLLNQQLEISNSQIRQLVFENNLLQDLMEKQQFDLDEQKLLILELNTKLDNTNDKALAAKSILTQRLDTTTSNLAKREALINHLKDEKKKFTTKVNNIIIDLYGKIRDFDENDLNFSFEQENLAITINENINFYPGKTAIRTKGKKLILDIFEVIQKYPNTKVIIHQTIDSNQSKPDFNTWQLANNRAAQIAYLISQKTYIGIDNISSKTNIIHTNANQDNSNSFFHNYTQIVIPFDISTIYNKL